ncbi:MAG: hypothetical protein ACFHX7_07300 [Pseudomonadota bacterium]
MRELTLDELDEVGGGVLANIGMGIGGATLGMAGYAMSGGITGHLTGSGFVGAGVAGFITGAGGFSPAAGLAGAVIGGAAEELASDS